MQACKVVCRVNVLPEVRDAILAGAPPGWQVVMQDLTTPEEETIEQAKDADFLFIAAGAHPKHLYPDRVFQSPRLKLIQTIGQGTDHIPRKLALERGIPVANSGGANAATTAEHTMTLMLAVMRRLIPGVEMMRQGKRRPRTEERYIHQLCQKTVGIVGLGSIGAKVARMVRGFEANVIFTKRSEALLSLVNELQATRVELEELLRTADIVTLHVPLVESTRRMIGWEQLTMMKPTAFVINTSRGGCVDEAALIRALQEKKIAGAGLDVFEQEPTSPDNPLLHMENVVATPHMGGASIDNWTPERIKEIWDNMLLVLDGKEPRNRVTIF